MTHIDVDKVRQYYDNNTSIFLKVGRSNARQNIHRQIWKEGVNNPEEATTYLNKYVEEFIHSYTDINDICDLGCGVGATLFYLSQRLAKDKNFMGYTLSPEQVKLAKAFQEDAGLYPNCQIEQGDFHQLPPTVPQDLIYAIESFIHSDRPELVFREVAKNLKVGGTFILMDDIKGSKFNNETSTLQTISNFKSGWHAGNFLSLEEIEKMAVAEGLKLVLKKNYTPYIKLWRLRDYFIHFMLFFYKLWPQKSVYFESLVGGDALQTGLKNRWIEFYILHFQKVKLG